MANASRQDLIDYCMRRLGFPVIEINVDDDQVSDRVDDALQFFNEYHFDGVEKTYVKHQITGSTINITSSVDAFNNIETITGSTSGATAVIDKSTVAGGTAFIVRKVKGTFTATETITGYESGATATTTSSNPHIAGDLENQYIPISTSVLTIIKLFPFGGTQGSTSTNNLFNLNYQFRMNDMHNLLASDMTYYSMMQSHLSTLDQLFVNQRQIRWNRKTNRLYVDTDWNLTFRPGDFLIAQAYSIIDPAAYTEVYDDMFLKKYTTALIKRQWGENMKKFGGIQLPGGVTLNGPELFQEAMAEIDKIEEEMQMKYELPPAFMIG